MCRNKRVGFGLDSGLAWDSAGLFGLVGVLVPLCDVEDTDAICYKPLPGLTRENQFTRKSDGATTQQRNTSLHFSFERARKTTEQRSSVHTVTTSLHDQIPDPIPRPQSAPPLAVIRTRCDRITSCPSMLPVVAPVAISPVRHTRLTRNESYHMSSYHSINNSV